MNLRRLHPPEPPQGTGATGGGSDRDGVHSGKRCRIQLNLLVSDPRGTIPPRVLWLHLRGEGFFVRGRMFKRCSLTCPRCATCTEPSR